MGVIIMTLPEAKSIQGSTNIELALDRGPGWPRLARSGSGWLRLAGSGSSAPAPASAPPAGLAPAGPGWPAPAAPPRLRLQLLRLQFKTIQKHFRAFQTISHGSGSSGWLRLRQLRPGWLRSAPAPLASIGPLLAPIRSGSGWLRLAGYGYRLQPFPRLAPAPPAPIISPGWLRLLRLLRLARSGSSAPAPAPAFSHYRARANNEFPVGKFYHGAALRLDHSAPAGPASPLRPWRPALRSAPASPLAAQLRPWRPSFASGGPPSDPLQRGPSKKFF